MNAANTVERLNIKRKIIDFWNRSRGDVSRIHFISRRGFLILRSTRGYRDGAEQWKNPQIIQWIHYRISISIYHYQLMFSELSSLVSIRCITFIYERWNATNINYLNKNDTYQINLGVVECIIRVVECILKERILIPPPLMH